MTNHIPGLSTIPHDGPAQNLKLGCDAPQCQARLIVQYRGDSGTEVAIELTRARAMEEGWSTRGESDLCPIHTSTSRNS